MRRLLLAALLASMALPVMAAAPGPVNNGSEVDHATNKTIPGSQAAQTGNIKGMAIWSESLSRFVDPAVDGLTVAPLTVTTTDKAGTLTSGGTAQAAIALNTARKGWCIQNPLTASENLNVRVGGTASATTGIVLGPGWQTCNQPGLVDTAAVSVYAATTGHTWLGQEVQ